jgi:uncharacterized membrane protein (DUF373 family)
VMPPGVQKNPADLIGLGFAILSLAAAYWLVRQSHLRRLPSRKEPTRSSQELDP